MATDGESLFCASDETGSVELLNLDQKAGSFRDRRSYALEKFFPKLRQKRNSAKGKTKKAQGDKEADVEGLAIDDGYLWITGSHSLKRSFRKEPRSLKKFRSVGWDRKRALLGRIPLAELDGSSEPKKGALRASRAAMMTIGNNPGDDPLRSLLRDDPILGSFIRIPATEQGFPSKENGFDVEGLAVSKGKVVIGLRGPVLGSYAFLVVLDLREKARGVLVPKRIGKKHYRLHAAHLFGLGIRDLLFDKDRLLILAGPTQKSEGLQRVFAVEDFLGQPEVITMKDAKLLLTLPVAGYGDHAEGIALFGEGSKRQLLVAYDSPSAARTKGGKDRLVIDAFDLPG